MCSVISYVRTNTTIEIVRVYMSNSENFFRISEKYYKQNKSLALKARLEETT